MHLFKFFGLIVVFLIPSMALTQVPSDHKVLEVSYEFPFDKNGPDSEYFKFQTAFVHLLDNTLFVNGVSVRLPSVQVRSYTARYDKVYKVCIEFLSNDFLKKSYAEFELLDSSSAPEANYTVRTAPRCLDPQDSKN